MRKKAGEHMSDVDDYDDEDEDENFSGSLCGSRGSLEPGLARKRLIKMAHKQAGKNYGPWREQESAKFIKAVEKYGKDWKKVADYVGTRDYKQVQHYCRVKHNRLKNDPNEKGQHILPILEIKRYKLDQPLH